MDGSASHLLSPWPPRSPVLKQGQPVNAPANHHHTVLPPKGASRTRLSSRANALRRASNRQCGCMKRRVGAKLAIPQALMDWFGACRDAGAATPAPAVSSYINRARDGRRDAAIPRSTDCTSVWAPPCTEPALPDPVASQGAAHVGDGAQAEDAGRMREVGLLIARSAAWPGNAAEGKARVATPGSTPACGPPQTCTQQGWSTPS